MARAIRAHCLASGQPPAQIALIIHSQCSPPFGTTLVRAHRLALGIALADVVAQVRARYVREGRTPPRFSETLLSSYEGGQKRPGPEYLHYLCCVYQAEPADLGYEGPCLCGQGHRAPVLTLSGPVHATPPEPRRPDGPGCRVTVCPAPHGARRLYSPRSLAEANPARLNPAGAPPRVRSGSPPRNCLRWSLAAPAGWPRRRPPRPPGPRPPSSPQRSRSQRRCPRQSCLPQPCPRQSCLPQPCPPQEWSPPQRRCLIPSWRRRPGPNRPGPFPGWRRRAPAADPAALSMGEMDDDMVRRTLLRLMADPGAPADGRFFGAVERIRGRLDEALLGSTVSVAMLDHWEGMTGEYGRQYMTVPPMRLLCDVLLDVGDVRRMCEQRQPLEFVERLCRLAARLTGLAGMTMINVGDHRMARSFFSTARTAADETGDRHLRAWVAVRESLVPLYYGDPAQAAAAARASVDLAGHQPCVAGVMAPVMEARALARLARARSGGGAPGTVGGRGGAGGAEVRRASAALDGAHEALERLPEEDRRDTAFGYTERQLLFHQGDALVTLGDYRGADDAFGQAMRLYSPAEFLDRSLVTLGQARCRLQAGEPEEALRLSRDTVLGLPSQHRPGIVLRAARSLGEAVAAKHGDFPAVRDYREVLVSR